MSREVCLAGSELRIEASRFPGCVEALLKARCEYDPETGQDVARRIRRFDLLPPSEQLARLLEEGWFFAPLFDAASDAPDVTRVSLMRGTVREQQRWMDALAPFVEPGGWVEMFDEDGNRWRHVFTDGKCRRVSPRIVWDLP